MREDAPDLEGAELLEVAHDELPAERTSTAQSFSRMLRSSVAHSYPCTPGISAVNSSVLRNCPRMPPISTAHNSLKKPRTVTVRHCLWMPQISAAQSGTSKDCPLMPKSYRAQDSLRMLRSRRCTAA